MWYWIGVAIVGLVVWSYLKSRARSSVVCPKCSTRSYAAAMKCSNCGRTGLKAEVILLHGVKSVFWKCKACKTNATYMQCSCGTDLSALFRE